MLEQNPHDRSVRINEVSFAFSEQQFASPLNVDDGDVDCSNQ